MSNLTKENLDLLLKFYETKIKLKFSNVNYEKVNLDNDDKLIQSIMWKKKEMQYKWEKKIIWIWIRSN